MNTESVELSSSFELECDLLDQDHKRLVNMVNEIVKEIDGGNARACKEMVPAFIDLAKRHFDREEAFLNKIGYPDVDQHHEHHHSLDEKMDHMLAFAETAADNELARESLKKELVFFVMDDIITADMDFKSFIKEKAKAGEG